MNRLINRWRETAFHQYFEALDPIDRATFWIVTALAFALALAIQAIVH